MKNIMNCKDKSSGSYRKSEMAYPKTAERSKNNNVESTNFTG